MRHDATKRPCSPGDLSRVVDLGAHFVAELDLYFTQIIGLLHRKPESRAGPNRSTDPQRRLRRDRALAGDDLLNPFRAHAEPPCEGGATHASCLKFFLEDQTRVNLMEFLGLAHLVPQ